MLKQACLPQITSLAGLLVFMRDDLVWPLPIDALADELTFDWTGDDLRVPQTATQKLNGGMIRQLCPLVSSQPWGIFLVEARAK